MAELKYLAHINLNENELQNAAMQILSSDPSGFEGHLFYNSSSNVLKFHNGTEYLTLSTSDGDITGVTAGNGLTGGGNSGGVTVTAGAGNGITVNTNDIAVTAAQTTITSVLNASLVVGRDADNDIDFGTDNNIIFRAGGADQIVLKDGVLEPVSDDDVDLGSSSKQFKNGYFDGTLEADAISINGTAISSTAAELNILDGVTSTAAELNILDGVTSTAAELNILDGVTATAAEINIIDGNTSATSTTLANADRVIVNDNGTMKQVAMTDVATYTNGSIEGTGALASGSIAAGFGAIDNGTSGIRTNTFTAETSFVPDASDGATLGSASLEFSDLYLADGAQILFGDDQEVRITHNADSGLTLSHEATGAATPFVLTIESEEDAITANDVLGGIQFKAGDSDGSDAILPAAGIFAIAADTFGSTSNRSKLVFAVAATETAGLASGAFDGTADMTLSHAGLLTIADDLVIKAGGTIGGADDTDLLTLGTNILTVAGEVSMTTLDIGGTNVSATAAELNIMDGVTATTAELNILDGVTSTAAELNILDGVTSTAAELNILDGVTSTAAELNVLDGITAVVGELNALDIGSTAVGTAVASKAVILDSNKDYTGIRNLTITGNLSVTGTTTQVDTVTMNAQNAVVFEGATADNHETTLTIVDPTADHTYKLPDLGSTNDEGYIAAFAADPGTSPLITSTPTELNLLDGVTSTTAELNILDGVTSTAAELNILDGVTSTAAELNILDGVTSTATEINLLDGSEGGTVVNNKAVIYDGNGVVNATTFKIGGTAITSTAAEINLIDGGTSRGTTAVANGDGFLHNDGGTMRMTNVSKLADLFAGTNISASSSVLSVANGAVGTKGVVTLASTAEALAGSSSSLAVTPAGLAARSFTATIGDGSDDDITIPHGLGTRNVIVQMYDASSYETVIAEVVRTDANNITINTNSGSSIASNDVIVLIQKID